MRRARGQMRCRSGTQLQTIVSQTLVGEVSRKHVSSGSKPSGKVVQQDKMGLLVHGLGTYAVLVASWSVVCVPFELIDSYGLLEHRRLQQPMPLALRRRAMVSAVKIRKST